MVVECPPPRTLQNALWPRRQPHSPTLRMRLQVQSYLDTPAWEKAACADEAQLPCVGISGPWDPHVREGAGAPWGGISLVQLQREGSGDLTAAPIPFLFHESCF